VTSSLPAKIWQHRIQPMAPAAPISTSTGTIRAVCIAPVNEHLVDYLVAASARW